MPDYYHSLTPFRKLFETGVPALTYHKLGPRPRSVQLKGLYVGEKLFTRQLAELREAGFSTPPLTQIFPVAGNSQKQIALTFDDGFSNVLRHGLKPLAENKFRAIQFLVADLIGKTNEWEQREGEVREPLMDVAQIREWLAAGHEIGSHTLTHPFLARIPLELVREEIFSSKKKLEDLFGRPVEHFCYPYGDWNETVRDLVIAAGYKTAFTTISGVNTPSDSPFELKRFTARYPSRNLKAAWSRLREKWQ
ncbi:MAG TPA: polysaccharide deacetylase family protein [Methylomirabilota bacterium]|nr:polysaccharide deacetylase family protein [Methylomirabilota bacterium]